MIKTFVVELRPGLHVVGIFESNKEHCWCVPNYQFTPFSREQLEKKCYPSSLVERVLADDFKARTHPDYFERDDDDNGYCFSTLTEETEIFEKSHPEYEIISQKIINEETPVESVQVEYVKK